MKSKTQLNEEFDKEYCHINPGDSGYGGNTPQEPDYYVNCDPQDIKDFITQTRQADVEELIEWAKSLNGAVSVDAQGRRFIDLEDLITHLIQFKNNI